jgi:hypothetical protein
VRSDPTGSPQKRSSPGSEDPGSPDNKRPLTKAAAPSPRKEADAAMLMVRHGDHSMAEAAVQGRCRSRRIPLANASLYEPAAGRTWWWISLRCPHCGSAHLGRVREQNLAGGPRRAGCGRRVWVKIRRVYRSNASSADVA